MEINKCPICGAEMAVEEEKPWIRLRCTNCPLDFGRYWFETLDLLIKSWNCWSGKKEIKIDSMSKNYEINSRPLKKSSYEKLFTWR